MKTFISDDFILHSKMSKALFHKYAEKTPIFDFHCHLNPIEILEDRRFNDLTEIWLAEDHYKWRLMRANGVEEKYITGDADHYEKFLKWSETIAKAIGNPLYHWTHLELKRYFDVDELLTPETAPEIWKDCNAKLTKKEFSARGLMRSSNVKALYTTDDPTDDLINHIELAKDKNLDAKVLPTFRPEKAIHLDSDGFVDWIACLSKVSGISIFTFEELITALEKRAEFFKSVGCKIADQSFGAIDFTKGTLEEAKTTFKKALAGKKLTQDEINSYKMHLLLALGKIYNKNNFVMQLHIGVIRNANTRLYEEFGADTGLDSMGDSFSAYSLIAFLNELDKSDELPKTVVYNLNHSDNAKIASVIGCFQSSPFASKLQLGSAWWFNDHIDGMCSQMKTLANAGLISNFIGMFTDSRSFLSYTRHEYFRRILCDLIGNWVEKGEVPDDEEMLGGIVEKICYSNAVKYFGLE